MENKSPDAFRTISEVAEWLGVPTHVLRFWESRFSQVKPVKRAGGRRYYRPNDMELLGGIRKLLHEDGMTIRGVQKLLREEGVKHVASLSPPLDSDEMRDVTPSNVVPLPGKPDEAEEQVTESADASDPGPVANEVQDTPAEVLSDNAATDEPISPPEVASEAAELAAPDASPVTEDISVAEPEIPPVTELPSEVEDAPSAPTDDETLSDPTAPVFGSARNAPGEPAPELPGMSDQADSPDPEADMAATTAPTPAPIADISHISADPSDDDVDIRPPVSSALRQARHDGTSAHIAALQALADRLESLRSQMGQSPKQAP